MNSILAFFNTYISYWPITVFLALLLAGFNLPISEDAMIILSATIVHEDKKLLIPTYIGLYLGILISDIISYFIGRLISKGFLQIKFLRKKLTPENIKWVSDHLDNHGFLTFIVCRFIPFGIRNMLFMGSGFVHLKFHKFILFDSIAAFISCTTLFTLVYFIGEVVGEPFRILGVILLIILLVVLILGIRKFINFRKNKKNKSVESESSEK